MYRGCRGYGGFVVQRYKGTEGPGGRAGSGYGVKILHHLLRFLRV